MATALLGCDPTRERFEVFPLRAKRRRFGSSSDVPVRRGVANQG